jgi:phenylacetate-CoA ligase
MSISEKWRAIVFWTYDFLKGSEIRKAVNKLTDRNNNTRIDQIKSETENRLFDLLKHALKTVPYYKTIKEPCLKDFPIIDKAIIKDNSDQFLSSSFIKSKLEKATTSGSTGAPLTVWKDPGKIKQHVAENIYFNANANLPLGRKIYYLRVWNDINRKSRPESFLQNIVMWDASELSDEKILNLIQTLRKDKALKGIIAFASTLEAIAAYIIRTNPGNGPRLSSIISISETLPDESGITLELFFRCSVFSRYSNIENGFIAQQCNHISGEYHLNKRGFIIEILKPDSDEDVPDGETGRIVITDLFNLGMPLIRYDTGDMAVMNSASQCSDPGPVFTKVEGRRVDFIYDSRGNLLSPHAITNTMWKYSSAIRQFQFIQSGAADYEIKINPFGRFNKEDSLIRDLKGFVGSNANIRVSIVDEIPVLSSGKRRKIVNNYKKA